MDLRTWVFVANRKLTDVETAQVENALQDFVATWSSHGIPLKASAFCFEQASIVVAADELVAKASGCSIDKITHLVRALGQQFNVDFFDRFKRLCQLLHHSYSASRFRVRSEGIRRSYPRQPQCS